MAASHLHSALPTRRLAAIPASTLSRAARPSASRPRRARLSSPSAQAVPREPTRGPELTILKVWQRLDPVLQERGYSVSDRLVLMKCTQAAFVALNQRSEPPSAQDGVTAPGDAMVLTSVRAAQARLRQSGGARQVEVDELAGLLLKEAVVTGELPLGEVERLRLPAAVVRRVAAFL
eukprot:jgi/Tetstr1/447841/TSEL_003758.t1